MPSRFGQNYQVTEKLIPRLTNCGFTHCISCEKKIKIGDWVRRTFGNIYHTKCLKRI